MWYLRQVLDVDIDNLYALCCIPEVYHYLADGAEPPREILRDWVATSHAEFESHGFGVWLLENDRNELGGCVRLNLTEQPDTAELTYLLHPDYWGQGLATRMSWTVMESAFKKGSVQRILAGADKPNVASIAVMKTFGDAFS